LRKTENIKKLKISTGKIRYISVADDELYLPLNV
jgi:hypothetical protein